jgi:hypothetical protein
MNLSDTIFILGAGASRPYGYPTAGQLRDDIIQFHQAVLKETIRIMNRSDEVLQSLLLHTKDIIKKFDLSHTNSIDLFLSRNLGKINTDLGIKLLWIFIMWYERNSSLSSQIKNRDEDWYFDFFNELTNDITTFEDLKNLPNEKINFVTFNYDRSLENYLFTSFMNSFSLSVEETTKLINNHFKFYHVYGKVANLEWESNDNTLEYKSKVLLPLADRAPQLINIIYSGRKIETEIKELIKIKIKVVFLGFGFAKANIDFLDLRELLTPNHKVYASGIGLHESRINKIKSFLTRGLIGIKDHNIIIDPKSNSLQLLRNRVF